MVYAAQEDSGRASCTVADDVVPALSKNGSLRSSEKAPADASEPGRYSTQSIFSRTAAPGLCHVLPYQNFDRSERSVTISQSTFICGIFRWHLGSEECGEIQLLKTQLEQKNRKPTLQEEPPWYSTHNGPPEEMRKSWKYVPRNSARPSSLSPGTVPRTTMEFWVSFENYRHLQYSGVIRTPSKNFTTYM